MFRGTIELSFRGRKVKGQKLEITWIMQKPIQQFSEQQPDIKTYVQKLQFHCVIHTHRKERKILGNSRNLSVLADSLWGSCAPNMAQLLFETDRWSFYELTFLSNVNDNLTEVCGSTRR